MGQCWRAYDIQILANCLCFELIMAQYLCIISQYHFLYLQKYPYLWPIVITLFISLDSLLKNFIDQSSSSPILSFDLIALFVLLHLIRKMVMLCFLLEERGALSSRARPTQIRVNRRKCSEPVMRQSSKDDQGSFCFVILFHLLQ